MYRYLSIPSAVVTASGASASIASTDFNQITCVVTVTAAAGSGVVTPQLQTSVDGTTWVATGSVGTAMSGGTGTQALKISVPGGDFLGKDLRLAYTITGTSVTFKADLVGR